MIISASRRTDIPAYYGEWFMNRIAEGFLYVRNPMNYHQVSKVKLSKDVVDCIVFWTKYPAPFMKYLNKIDNYNYYFQFTLTPYDKSIEANLPDKEEIINTFIHLSKIIGKEKIIWRYDPIILSQELTIDYHLEKFKYLLTKLNGYTEKCIISFLDIYSNTEKNMRNLNIKPISENDMRILGTEFIKLAQNYDIKLESCAEKANLLDIGISHGKCIDDKLISRITNHNINISKDKNQREQCGCITSIDIGMYNTCMNNCSYCYANFNKGAVKTNFPKHNINSPLLIGELMEKDKITERKMESYISSNKVI